MGEKIAILGVLTIVCGSFLSTATYADEVDCVIDPTNEACIVTTNDEIPVNTPADDLPIVTGGETDDVLSAGEDSDGSEEIVVEDDEEVATEPALWPMYLSLGSLGLAVLVFIILSICSPKLKK